MLASSDQAVAQYATWTENNDARNAVWCIGNNSAIPKRIQAVDDRLTADTAFLMANQGTHMLWRGDFQNARQLLNALARRIDKKKKRPTGLRPQEAFNLHRLTQSQRARLLNTLLIELNPDCSIDLRRAPDVSQAYTTAFGEPKERFLLSLRALQGIIGAYEWRRKGIVIPALQGSIHVHYGVFSPIRGEYIDLVANAPLPEKISQAFDIGTGSSVLAAILARRGVPRIIATDIDDRALACAQENIARLGVDSQVSLQSSNLFPQGQSELIVCNPPWLPARPTSPIEHAIYDPDSQMLKGFIQGLPRHLTADGEAWLIMSDLAEHLGLRSRDFLLDLISQAGLSVKGRLDARPKHPKAFDIRDPLHEARSAETTSLWRLARL